MPVLELTDEQVISLLKQLPEEQRTRIIDRLSHPAKASIRPQFGIAKNDILFIADDFDAPMDDFAEYM